MQLAGDPTQVQLSYRNASKVWFVAREIDHVGFMQSIRAQRVRGDRGILDWHMLSNWHSAFVNPYQPKSRTSLLAAKRIGPVVAQWSVDVPDDGSHRYAEIMGSAPLKASGAYLITAYLNKPAPKDLDLSGRDVMNSGTSRAVCVINDLAMVRKQTAKGNLYYICDARTGAPVAGASVHIVHVWTTWNKLTRHSVWHKKEYSLSTDMQGTALLADPASNDGSMHALVTAGSKRAAWSDMHYWRQYNPSHMQQGLFAYCITDRPVYRPEQAVRYKIWLRDMRSGVLSNAPGRNVSLTVYDPRGNKVYTASKTADPYGGVDGDFLLSAEPTLGVYRVQIDEANVTGGANFRVEEYKKPEFEVVVEPGKTHAKLGEKLMAMVRAKYYFGAPVTDATVSYKIFREEFRQGYVFPGQWDWLYGSGYGWAWYDYDWFPWWASVRCCRVAPGWWYGAGPVTPVRELVQQGAARIGADGELALEIDTEPALKAHPDRDHRYVIQAEVRDASRRVITGEGAVTATRQAYYAYVQADRGYVRPGEETVVKVGCFTPDGRPVATEGVITVRSITYGGRLNAKIEEKELRRWAASTDERGLLEFRIRHERSDLLRIDFESPDEWGGVVTGHGLVWVCGEDFNGRFYRFNDLEILTDKRTYQPGETAHIMINAKHDNSYVLFSDDVDNSHLRSWRLLHLPQRHMIVDIPITRERKPNFFVEATTVRDGRAHEQSRRICVPPEEGMVTVRVETDKPEYKPGERAHVKVSATTLDGRPAQAQVALSAFDRSVLYIQPEFAPPIAKFFHGNVRRHRMLMSTNLVEQFRAWGSLNRPYQNLHWVPSAWNGVWGVEVDDFRTFDMDSPGRRRSAGSGNWPVQRYALEIAAPSAAPMKSKVALTGGAMDEAEGVAGGGGPPMAEATVRTQFADTALWLATLTTDADGTADVEFTLPENLTTWKVNTWAMTADTRVGQADTSAVTTKNLLVRLQAPRFFMEYDEVVISANVHNYLNTDKDARVSLDVPAEFLQRIGDGPEVVAIKVPAGGERRVDWRVKVLKEGMADITVKALTDEESDAMRMTFPVLVHGITKQVATTGGMRPDDVSATATVELDIPEQRRPELTRLEVKYAPSLVGAMMDALPYCITYPYGCTEQTMSRFLGATLTLKTLQNMGVDLADVKKIRGRLDEVRRVEKGEHIPIYADSPIFDDAELHDLIAKGLARITNMQNGDGGWGWWKDEESSSYLTSYVLYGLVNARACDVPVDAGMVERGMDFLKRWEEGQMPEKHWSVHAQHAYVAYVLALGGKQAVIKPEKDDERPAALLDRLFEGRDKLGHYGKALLTLALIQSGDTNRADLVLQNILQYLERNEETQVAWFRTPAAGWWYWWNSDIETNATILRALVKLRPKSDVAPQLVKWLLNNRRNGYYWRSTRDTTVCLAAMSEFVTATGEGAPDYTLTLDFDNGAVKKSVRINRDNFFTYDNTFVMEGLALSGGKHTLKITKEGRGALYFNTYLRYFTKEVPIKAAGHELKVERSYRKLVQISYEVDVEDATGRKIKEKRLRYERVPLNTGDAVASGDVIQVELRVKSDNDYTYLCFEDMKPAGCEPVDVRSGGKGQEGFYSYMELRDEKVVFFIPALEQGEHLMRYRLRAETPGLFHALPTVLYGMYVPELRANADEHIMRITD